MIYKLKLRKDILTQPQQQCVALLEQLGGLVPQLELPQAIQFLLLNKIIACQAFIFSRAAFEPDHSLKGGEQQGGIINPFDGDGSHPVIW